MKFRLPLQPCLEPLERVRQRLLFIPSQLPRGILIHQNLFLKVIEKLSEQVGIFPEGINPSSKVNPLLHDIDRI